MQWLFDRISQEPAVVVGLVQAGIVLGVSFGLDMTETQTAAILAFTAAVLAFVTRSQVSPVQKGQ